MTVPQEVRWDSGHVLYPVEALVHRVGRRVHIDPTMFHQQCQPPDIGIRLLVDEKIRVVNGIRDLPHDIITQITPQIMRRDIMELEPTVMGALFEVMRTQLHYDRAVPANAVVPDGPDVFREGCPL